MPNDYDYQMNPAAATTRGQRVRAAILADSLEDPHAKATSPNSQIQPGSYLHRLIPATQQLKQALANLVEYQADAEHTMRAVPEMVRLLQDDDRLNVALKAAAFVNQLSQKDAPRVAMSQSPQLISAIISQLNSCQPNEVDLMHHLINALHNICTEVTGVQLTFNSGGIPALVRLLSFPIDNVLFYAITILHTLLVYEETAKAQIRKCGGIQKMCALLTHNNQKFLAKLVDCLKMLAFNSNESKLIISASAAAADLVRIMRVSNYEKLLWTCVRLMKVLSVCSANKAALLDAGAMQVLTAHIMQPANERLLINALLTVRNLSDCASSQENLEALVRKLVEYLSAQNVDFNIGNFYSFFIFKKKFFFFLPCNFLAYNFKSYV